jgi:hypothetical protein
MLFCQMGGAHSLREICGGLASAMGKLVHLGLTQVRIPLKSASDSEANRPALWSKSARGRSEATLEFLS